MPRSTLEIPTLTEAEASRFWSKVAIAEPEDCWLWQGATDGAYGLVRLRNRNFKAHRVAYVNGTGKPLGLSNANHGCDVTTCCNPQHLWPGTNGDNNRDRESKQRGNQPKGEHNGQARLTESDVSLIRQSSAPAKSLASEYGVHFSTIYRIRNHQRWKHI